MLIGRLPVLRGGTTRRPVLPEAANLVLAIRAHGILRTGLREIALPVTALQATALQATARPATAHPVPAILTIVLRTDVRMLPAGIAALTVATGTPIGAATTSMIILV